MSLHQKIVQNLSFVEIEQLYNEKLSVIQRLQQERQKKKEELDQIDEQLASIKNGKQPVAPKSSGVRKGAGFGEKPQDEKPSLTDCVYAVMKDQQQHNPTMRLQDIAALVLRRGYSTKSTMKQFCESVRKRGLQGDRFRRVGTNQYALSDTTAVAVADAIQKPVKNETPAKEHAYTVLQQAHKPMSVPEIAGAILRRGYKTVSSVEVFSQTVVSMLCKDARFVRTAQGIYGLVEWTPKA